ncbi:ferredoxin [Blastococcus sp. URHD0036]|uniref:ferredoxin n=1 Tax=Blastococcus sp. URHD0036 TaxID=1380356 RepID=UPI0004978E1E|nr:(4Fe-4S)-binding protein [Blastococcus sp. URHD0036]
MTADRGGGPPLDIRVDRDLCMGSGQCTIYAPRTFAQDDATIAYVLNPDGGTEEEVRDAISACPTGALSIAGETGD